MKTKNLLSLILLLNLTLAASAQQSSDSTLFDFWLGEWNLTWTNSKGKTDIGTNHIVKILDGKVIQENFSDETGNFKGMSVSVYNTAKKIWHQAWVDNQGGYFDFEGEAAGERRIFKTKMKEENGKKIVQRMVFYNIKPNSLTWDWELSRDNGVSWELQWRIHYVRKSS